MTVTDGETILQRALEAFLEARSRIISDNGPQVVARDFRAFIRMCGMMHVRTSPHYPRSNGKIERWYKTLRQDCIRPKTPLSMKDVHRTAAHFVKEYNELRSHSGIGYITPKDHLERQEQQIQAARRNNVQAVRAGRSAARHREEVGSASTCATSASPGIILIASAEIPFHGKAIQSPSQCLWTCPLDFLNRLRIQLRITDRIHVTRSRHIVPS